jgi:hypothetical protein
MFRHHFPLAVAKLLGLKHNACPLDPLNGVGATLSVAHAKSLKQQLLHQTVDQRFNALITVAGGRNGKGVLVNAHQRNHFAP